MIRSLSQYYQPHLTYRNNDSFCQLFSALDADVPATWWDSCCDKCLLLGVFKHGWEKYLAIRDDPALCFYRRVYGDQALLPPLVKINSAIPLKVEPIEAAVSADTTDSYTPASAGATGGDDEGMKMSEEEDEDEDRSSAPNLGEAQLCIDEMESM